MSDTGRWLSVEEIGTHLGVSKETIYRWIEKKKIPAHRLGRLWKFKTIEVDQWVMNGGAVSENENNKQRTVWQN